MEERISWYKSPLDKEKLRTLRERSDAAGWRQAGGFLLIYVVNTALAVYFFQQQLWIPMVLVCYWHSWFLGFMGMGAAVHELSHSTPFKTKWLSEFFYGLFSFLTWNNPVHFRHSHRQHHQLTVYRGKDKEVVLDPIALSPWVFLRWLTFDYAWFKMIMKPNIAHFFGKGDADFFFWDPMFQKGDKRRAQMILWARFMMFAHFALLAIFSYFKLWVLIYTVTFGYFFVTFGFMSAGSLQHLGMRPNVPDWRLSCHTFLPSPLVRFLYWNMNYHIEHHMYAAVPFYNLPRLHKAIKKDMPEPLSRSVWGGIKKLMEIQKRQQEEPGFCYDPVFPESATPPSCSLES